MDGLYKGIQCSSVAQPCPTLCDPMNRSTPTSLSITISRSSLRLVSIESVMPSSHLHRRHSNKVLAQSLWGLWVLAHTSVFFFELSVHLWWVWGLIINVTSPVLQSNWGFSFSLGCGVSFFGGIQHSPVDGCSRVSCSFGVLAGEAECMSYSAIL